MTNLKENNKYLLRVIFAQRLQTNAQDSKSLYGGI